MASKRRLRRQACTNKKRHPTLEKAQAQAAFVHSVSGKHLHAYRCSFCGEFHLGHMPSRVRAVINERRIS